ncbi:MAG: hypothetical protein JJ975_06915 [Bacteroidia bacterium]|nr:hypothetical protein [Bacteroidia bacterium]
MVKLCSIGWLIVFVSFFTEASAIEKPSVGDDLVAGSGSFVGNPRMRRFEPRWTQYLEVNHLVSIYNQEDPTIWNLPENQWGFNAIPVESFTTEQESLQFLKYKPDRSFRLGLIRHFPRKTILDLSLNYSTFTQVGGISRLRFTDMIAPGRGFVQPTSMSSDTRVRYAYRALGLGLAYRVESRLRKPPIQQRIGFGIHWTAVLGSHYNISTNIQPETDTYFYEKDVRFSDRIFRVYPSANYEIRLMRVSSANLWFKMEYAGLVNFMPDRKSASNSSRAVNRFSYVGVGVRLESR